MTNRGFYTGSLKMEQPWYRRRMKHAGLPERGPGEYWYDYQGFYFLQETTHRGARDPHEIDHRGENSLPARRHVFPEENY